jgi:hypothetical protein
MENLQEVERMLKSQLADVQNKIANLKPKPTIDDMRQTVASWHECKKWKKFASQAYGVVDNIVIILEDCYDSFVESIEEEFPDKDPKSIIGKFKSAEWRQFQLKVIAELINPSRMDQDFEDTASGCDEVAWDAGLEVIRILAK